MTFSQTYNSFLGMYQVSYALATPPHAVPLLIIIQVFSSEDWTDVLFGAVSSQGTLSLMVSLADVSDVWL